MSKKKPSPNVGSAEKTPRAKKSQPEVGTHQVDWRHTFARRRYGFTGYFDAHELLDGLQRENRDMHRRVASSTDAQPLRIGQLIDAIMLEVGQESLSDRRTAIELIGKAAEPIQGNQYDPGVTEAQQGELLNLLGRSLGDADEGVRQATLEALEQFLDRSKVQTVRVLSDTGIPNNDARVAVRAIRMLHKVGIDAASQAVPALAVALRHADSQVRGESCEMLGQLGEDGAGACAALVQLAVGDSDDGIRLAAIQALLAILPTSDVAERLDAAADQPRLLSLLRSGGDDFRQVRRMLQRLPAATHARTTFGAKVNTRRQPAEAKPADEPILSHIDLAKHFKRDPEATRKLLERWRKTRGDGWHEVQNHKRNEPKYLYHLSAVASLFDR